MTVTTSTISYNLTSIQMLHSVTVRKIPVRKIDHTLIFQYFMESRASGY